MASCSSNYIREMNQVTAKRLFKEGGTLIFLDVPPNTEFGIDLQSWNTGEKFKGVKMIPPGIHFIYYSAVSKDGQTAPRTGFFHSFGRREVLVKKYDPQMEDIVDASPVEAEVEEFRRNLIQMDQYLGPYPYDIYKGWISLTNHITETVLQELQPLNSKISSASELVLDPTNELNESSSKRLRNSYDHEGCLPRMKIKPGTEIRFTEFPSSKHPDGCSAAEISRHNMDLSFSLKTMMRRYKNREEEFLGELQMAFVCFVIGQVYEAFEQWKQLVQLLCTCDDALVAHPALFQKFITCLYFQISQVPKDLFVDIVTGTNFLTTTLHVFFSNLESSERASTALVEKGRKFSAYLTKKFHWRFDVDPEDCAPVVVEI